MSRTQTSLQPEVLRLSSINEHSTDVGQASSGTILDTDLQHPENAFEVIPDGGKDAWLVICACAALMFWASGFPSTWGVLQTAILKSSYLKVDTSTISFVGSLCVALNVALTLVSLRLIRSFGARRVCMVAVVVMGSGLFTTSYTLDNLGGLFVTAGALVGLGSCALWTVGNSLPVQWFSSKLGTSNGIVKAGGGLGATVLPVISQKSIDTLGLPWTFRILGFAMLATCLPFGLLLKERQPGAQKSRIDWSLLRKFSFLCVCLAGAVITFALFVPAYFIPLFASSIGLSASTGAGLVAGFGLASTVGRLSAGFACDRIGPLNTLAITTMVNAISMLAIWPVSSSLGPLILFATINGVANGSFFATMAVALASLSGPGLASGAISIGTSFWTPGYLFGSAIAGALISATGAAGSSSIKPYRLAIFYAGGVALLGGMLAFLSRFTTDRKILKKL